MKKLILLATFLLQSCSSSRKPATDTDPILAVQQSPTDRSQYESSGKSYIIATQGYAATEAAQKIYALGGNIIDATIAASFVISVERPQSTGIGGGGFLLYREAKSGKTYAVDFRERAPAKAHQNLYLDSKGEVISGLSSKGPLAVGTPGLVAGLLEIHSRFGRLPRKTVMNPAIELAEKGFVVYPHLANAIKTQQDLLKQYPASAKIFLKSDGSPYEVGDTLIQKDLASSLRKIANYGRSVFYNGSLGNTLVSEIKKQNGLVSTHDLKNYKVKWREPVQGTYKNYSILSMPPPSSGGTHVIQILNILESGKSKISLKPNDPQSIHLKAFAMQQAFADRATYMGDPDFFKQIPLKQLLSKHYADNIQQNFDADQAQSSQDVKAGTFDKLESTETTNFAIMDNKGNTVVSTQTINGWMGSGVVIPGTGILMNNEMDDFSAKPGSSNIYGAVGGAANSVMPLKTPLSSMAPTIVLENNKPIVALGAPGGTRIITCVAQTLVNYLDHKMSLYDSIASLRIHHQWQPDQLDIESPGFGKSAHSKLEKMGYRLNVGTIPCRVNAVAKEGAELKGVADPRDIGAAFGGG